MAGNIRFNERALDQVLRQAATNYGTQLQPSLDQFATAHLGQPAAIIKPKLERWLKQHGLSGMSQATLKGWATRIERGEWVELR